METSTTKFVLSPYCRIIHPEKIKLEKITDPDIKNKVIANELTILQDDHTWHLINPSIKYFLQQFGSPVTLHDATKALAIEAGCDTAEIEKITNTFFHDMRRLNLLRASDEHPTSSNQRASMLNTTLQDRYVLTNRIFNRKDIEIYIASDRKQSIGKVIKMCRLDGLRGQERENKIKQFKQEFDIHAEIPDHPNICRFYAFNIEGDVAYAVLEKLDKLSFRKLYKKQTTSYSHKITMMKGVIHAVAHLHRNRLLHGDIHLSNFLIQKDYHIKLIDFNLSNRANPNPDENIRHGGVFQYIAPEIINTDAFEMVKKRADYTTEVWQLGIVLYFIYYEKMPFDDFTWHELANSIQHVEPVHHRTTPRGEPIDRRIIHLIRICLSKDQSKRPANAQVVAHMLDDL